jgi:hypothetical protein
MTLLVDDEEIYILDYGNHKVKVFNMEGVLEREMGNGRGEGPGQVIHAGEFDVERDTIWMVDLRGRKVVKYTKNGKYIGQFRVNHPINKIETLGDDIVVRNPAGVEPFVRYSKGGVRLSSFGNIGKKGADNPISVTGHMAQVDSSSFAYLTHYASYVFKYSNFDLKNELILVDGQKFSDGEEKNDSGGVRYMSPDVDVQYLEISTDNENTFVLTQVEKRAVSKNVLIDIIMINQNMLNHIYWTKE